MWYLTVHRWTGDRQQAISDVLGEHLSWMSEQLRSGTVLLAGPSADMEVGIIVFRDMDRVDVERLCRTEPFVVGGHRDFELIAWDVHQLFGIDAHGG